MSEIIPSRDECKHSFVDSYKGKPGSYPFYTVIERINDVPAFRITIKEVDCQICGLKTTIETSRQKISYNDPVAITAKYEAEEAQEEKKIKTISATIAAGSFVLMLLSLFLSPICIFLTFAAIFVISWFVTLGYISRHCGGWSGYI